MFSYISGTFSFLKRLYYYFSTKRQLEEYGIHFTEKEYVDRQGRKFAWVGTENGTFGAFKEWAEKQMGNERFLQRIVDVKQLELRDDDIMICTYPRTGNI